AVDGGTPQAIVVNGSATITRLSAGSHTVVLSGVAANCAVTGSASRSVSIASGQTVPVIFDVTCVAVTGSIQVTTATSGIDLDPNGYGVQIDGGSPRSVFINGTTTIEGLSAGNHSVTLANAEANCTVAGANPRTIPVTTGGVTRDTARTTFQVTCVAVTGTIKVTAATSGIDLDPNGYTVLVDGGQLQALPLNGAAIIEGLSGGDHSVGLFGAAGNCTVTGQNPQTVHVTTGSITRDTARSTFQVGCVAVQKIAFEREGTIVVVYADGSNAVTLVQGTGPTWSPDGAKIAYAAISCYDYYYYCYPVGLAVMGVGQLTSDPSDAQPAWSPDGTKIAFTSSRSGHPGLWVVNATGGSPTLITDNPRSVSKPAWSPNSAQLAFTCVVDTGNSDICRIDANGTGFVRLTSDLAQDAAPAWKPGGSMIAFATTR